MPGSRIEIQGRKLQMNDEKQKEPGHSASLELA